MSTASTEVSNTSQTLAEGASQQAAAIEETSSSLEEMSSMTKQNADHANQADGLMKKATEVIGVANTKMKALTVSMEDISRSSEGNIQDHQNHRRNCLPDQSPGTECCCGSRPCR